MIKVWGKPNCTFCERATKLLDYHEMDYEYIDIVEKPDAREVLFEKGFKTVPQIWVDSTYIGGYTDLQDWLDGEVV